MTKKVRWNPILGLKGVRTEVDERPWGFLLSIETSCTKKNVKEMVRRMRAHGYDAHYHFNRASKNPGVGVGVIGVYNEAYIAAKAKLTTAEFRMLVTAALCFKWC